MWKLVVGVIAAWIVLSLALAASCHQLSNAVDACHPGVVTKTDKDGNKSTTIDCTAVGKDGGR